MPMADAELTALSMRGEYTLAYEAAMAARFIGIIIAHDRITLQHNPETQKGREAILLIAQELIKGFGNSRVEIALQRFQEKRDLFS